MKLLAVNFHYVRDEIYTSGIYPRSIKQISEQIDALSKYYIFISQEELITKIRTKEYDKKNYCLLTFDDGLKEQMNALDLLVSRGIPAIFYVTTHAIRNTTVVDVHKLHYIRSLLEDKDIYQFIMKYIDPSTITYPANINELYRYDTLETKKLKYLLNFILETTLKEKIINDLFATLTDETALSKKLYMNTDDIQKLDKLNCLGTHSDSHLPLATLDEVSIRNEIENSIQFLTEVCHAAKPKSISYPYGGPKAVSPKVTSVSQEFDFDFGLTMFRGINEITDLQTPLMLKRIDTNDAPGGKMNSTEFCL